MTNLEAIKAKLNYPLSNNAFNLALLDRSLTSSATYATTDKESLELAQADLIYTLATTPNITEGGYKIVLSDKQMMLDHADNIYKKYGVMRKPTAKFVNKW